MVTVMKMQYLVTMHALVAKASWTKKSMSTSKSRLVITATLLFAFEMNQAVQGSHICMCYEEWEMLCKDPSRDYPVCVSKQDAKNRVLGCDGVVPREGSRGQVQALVRKQMIKEKVHL
ncbi:hypothetical protein OG21DRAFT_1527771 [Imleria badia]|nr:hypothetical protein OG21DRAFT_1527771 [Imleria badia]